MTESTLQLEIPVLLPHIEDECDQCVERLNEHIATQKGIYQAHVKHEGGQTLICLHYDPNELTLDRVQRLAERAGATVEKRYRHETLHVTGMDCPDCARSIEHVLGRVDGIVGASVSYAAERLRVEYDAARITHSAVVRQVGWLGYHVEEPGRENWLNEHIELLMALLAGLLLAVAFAGQRFLGFPGPLAIGIYSLAYLAGGYDAAHHGFKAALKLRFEVDLLMVVAAIGAAALGNWAEGALLLFLFSLGHGLEHYAMGRARHAVQALGKLAPRTARVQRNGSEQELPVEALQRGDVVIVRAGERMPADGVVRRGHSAVDQSAITGESVPVDRAAGDTVFAGTVNGDGTLEVEVARLAGDTTLARVMQMVDEAQTQKSPTQRITERFTGAFVPTVLGLVVLTIIVPPLLGWLPWQAAFLRAMTILVAASPCALAIATPAAVLSGVAQAARNGVLIKGGMHLENLGRIRAMAFDKTGTLTSGTLRVTDVIPLNGTDPEELLLLAAAIESRSSHPLAQAICRCAREKGLDAAAASVTDVGTLGGRGVHALVDAIPVEIGNLKLFAGDGTIPATVAAGVTELEQAGRTTMVLRQAGSFVGIVGLADSPRLGVQATMARLSRLGIAHLIMLTGDNERVAAAVAGETGMNGYRAGLLPEDKLAAVRELEGTYGRVAMLGDGVNDAPALAAATVGIAMGAGGTDVALETADVALMADDLGRLPFAVGLSRQSNRIIRQNLAIALGVIIMLIPAALLGIAGIGPAILFHEGSTVAVVLNALRLLGYRERTVS